MNLRKEFVGKTRRSRFFLDSGAHSLYNREILQKGGRGYAWFDTQEFRDYLDDYAKFVQEHADCVDHYASVDVIYDPERSYRSLKYLEKEHGLSPVPVVHHRTDEKWLHRYLDEGYSYIGFGGLGQKSTRASYVEWADRMFDIVCDTPDRTPRIKVHGFAMTSYELTVRYPWYSTDSSSWAKCAAFGSVLIPHKRDGEFVFFQKRKKGPVPIRPYMTVFTLRQITEGKGTKGKGTKRKFRKEAGVQENPLTVMRGPGCYWGRDTHDAPMSLKSARHFDAIRGQDERDVILEWLDLIGVPLGTNDKDGNKVEEGVINHYGARGVANLRFYKALCEALKWPRPFYKRSGGSFL